MTVVSVLIGAAVEVGVGSKPTSKSTSLFLYHIYILFSLTLPVDLCEHMPKNGFLIVLLII